MSDTLRRWTRAALLCTLGTASATPYLPSSTVAAQAVRDALGNQAPAAARSVSQPTVQVAAPAARAVVKAAPTRPAPSRPVARVSTPAVRSAVPVAAKAAKAPAVPVARKAAPAKATPALSAAQVRARGVALAQGQAAQRTGRSVVARATAYNSMPGQTDSTPFITATGTRTRPGVVALSRDLLRSFPYGSRVMIEDLSGRSGNLLAGRVFYVEDTMAAYKRSSVDIWMSSYGQAIRFGARQVRVTAVR